jgi:hypothetical protein
MESEIKSKSQSIKTSNADAVTRVLNYETHYQQKEQKSPVKNYTQKS